MNTEDCVRCEHDTRYKGTLCLRCYENENGPETDDHLDYHGESQNARWAREMAEARKLK